MIVSDVDDAKYSWKQSVKSFELVHFRPRCETLDCIRNSN